MRPIPVSAAKRIAQDFDYDQVVIIARKVGEGEHCTTYGKDKENCRVAGRIGDFLKFKVMGWVAEPPALTDSNCPNHGAGHVYHDGIAFCLWCHKAPCPWCKGTGKRTHPGDAGDAFGKLCSRCEGAGTILAPPWVGETK